jgi:AbrB family looped-hinge helix DNA binding protein
MHTSNLTSKGQVTVPASIRHELGLKPGDKVRFVRKGKAVLIEAVVEEPLDSLFGLLKAPAGRGIADVDAAVADAIHARHRDTAGR